MILQKSFLHADVMLKKQFLLLSMLEKVMPLNIIVETWYFFPGFFDK